MRMQLRHSKKKKKEQSNSPCRPPQATGKAGVPAFWESFTDVAVGSWLATPAVLPCQCGLSTDRANQRQLDACI